MGTTAQRLNRPWVRAVTSGVMGAAFVTGIFILAGGQVSERVFVIPLIYAGMMGAAALVLPWIERCELQLGPSCSARSCDGHVPGVAALGAMAASEVVLATGLVPAERFWTFLTSGLGIALLVAVLLCGHEIGRTPTRPACSTRASSSSPAPATTPGSRHRTALTRTGRALPGRGIDTVARVLFFSSIGDQRP